MWDCHRIFSKKCFFCVGVYRILPESIWFEESGWFDSPVPSQCWEVWEVPRVPCWTPSWMKSWRTNVSWTSAPFAHRRRWGCLSIRGMVRYGVEWFCRNSWERLWNDSGGNQMMKHNSFSLAHWHGLWIHEIPWDSSRFHEIPVSHQPQSHAWPQLPLYVDRLLLLAKNADGLGNPTTTEGIITDRIGQTGSFQKPLDMAAHGTATAGTISTKIQKCREKIGESVRVVYTYRFWIFETRNGFFYSRGIRWILWKKLRGMPYENRRRSCLHRGVCRSYQSDLLYDS